LNDKEIRVSRLVEECGDRLGLEVLNRGANLDIPVRRSDTGRPGLLLSGFEPGFRSDVIQVIGETEALYLGSLGPDERSTAFRRLLEAAVPAIIAAEGVSLDARLLEEASSAGVPVFGSSLSPSEIVQTLKAYLLVELAPETAVNGTLVDVYGVGILLRGKSGIGKSECALDLVERGHRLVADDLVRIIATPPGMLIGRSSRPLQDYVEVRGIGLIDIGSIYGIKALRRQKRIEVEVNLREWEQGMTYDRSGLDQAQSGILGVSIPSLVVPLVPGKSLGVIVEVIALSHILRVYGYDAASTLNENWIRRLNRAGGRDFEARDRE
jgi:HPr kinase/phosphorylase